jgi:hypothetical protein
MIQQLAVVLAAILIIGAVVFIGIQVWAYGGIWLNGLRLRRSLAGQGRTIELREAAEKIRQKEGMIIVDAPTLGWNVSRVWWSPAVDFVPRPASWNEDHLCPHEDFLNYKKFIDPCSGVAKLVASFVIDQRLEGFLKRHFGTSASAFVFTGGVLTEEQHESTTAKIWRFSAWRLACSPWRCGRQFRASIGELIVPTLFQTTFVLALNTLYISPHEQPPGTVSAASHL